MPVGQKTPEDPGAERESNKIRFRIESRISRKEMLDDLDCAELKNGKGTSKLDKVKLEI